MRVHRSKHPRDQVRPWTISILSYLKQYSFTFNAFFVKKLNVLCCYNVKGRYWNLFFQGLSPNHSLEQGINCLYVYVHMCVCCVFMSICLCVCVCFCLRLCFLVWMLISVRNMFTWFSILVFVFLCKFVHVWVRVWV